MSGYAAFLRGMNVGGHRISNAELGARFEELGFSDVSTFRASGNVVFAATDESPGGGSPRGRSRSDKSPKDGSYRDGSPSEIAQRIETGLEAALGYAVPVFLRSAKEVRQIAAQQPFAESLIEASKGKLQVMMLARRPAVKALKEVLSLASDEDRLMFSERELYWLPSGGILDSKLDFKLIEKLLGPATTRTKNTVEQLVRKYFAE
jgi:uncharacterized protein (DUF1697 family)